MINDHVSAVYVAYRQPLILQAVVSHTLRRTDSRVFHLARYSHDVELIELVKAPMPAKIVVILFKIDTEEVLLLNQRLYVPLRALVWLVKLRQVFVGAQVKWLNELFNLVIFLATVLGDPFDNSRLIQRGLIFGFLEGEGHHEALIFEVVLIVETEGLLLYMDVDVWVRF